MVTLINFITHDEQGVSSVIHELSAKISAYIDKGKHRSLNRLAKDAGIPYATLRRIAQNEVKECTIENVIKILSVLETKNDVMAFCQKHFECGKYLANTTQTLDSYSNLDINECFSDFNKWICLCLLEKSAGTSERELSDFIGKKHIKETLQYFESRDLISYNDNVISLKKRNFSHSTVTSTLNELAQFTKVFNSQNVGTLGHQLSAFVAELSENGVSRIEEIYQKASKEVNKVMKEEKQKPSSERNKQAFFGSISGILGE